MTWDFFTGNFVECSYKTLWDGVYGAANQQTLMDKSS